MNDCGLYLLPSDGGGRVRGLTLADEHHAVRGDLLRRAPDDGETDDRGGEAPGH